MRLTSNFNSYEKIVRTDRFVHVFTGILLVKQDYTVGYSYMQTDSGTVQASCLALHRVIDKFLF